MVQVFSPGSSTDEEDAEDERLRDERCMAADDRLSQREKARGRNATAVRNCWLRKGRIVVKAAVRPISSPEEAVEKVTGQGTASSWCRPLRLGRATVRPSLRPGSSQVGHLSSFSWEGGESLEATKQTRLRMAHAERR